MVAPTSKFIHVIKVFLSESMRAFTELKYPQIFWFWPCPIERYVDFIKPWSTFFFKKNHKRLFLDGDEHDKFFIIKCTMKWFFKSENAGNEQKNPDLLVSMSRPAALWFCLLKGHKRPSCKSLDIPWVKSPETSGNTGDYPTSRNRKQNRRPSRKGHAAPLKVY